jgi:hypothetical protein
MNRVGSTGECAWRRSALLFLAVVSLALAACGGGKDDAADFARLLRGLSLPYPVAEAETAIMSRFGDRPGARAVFLAADRGYTVQQIVAAGVEARLSGQGAVVGASGGEEAPLGKSSGRFSLASATDSLYASLKAPQRHPAPATLDLLDEVLDVLGGGVGPEYVVEASGDKIDVRPKPTEAGRTLTGTILGLLVAGYDLDTIIEAIFFQSTSIDFQGAVYLFDENGLICPQLSDFCEEQLKDLFDGEWRRAFGLPDREEPARPSGDLAGIYQGELTFVQCFGQGCRVQCEVVTTLSLGLDADGAIQGRTNVIAMWDGSSACREPVRANMSINGQLNPEGDVFLEIYPFANREPDYAHGQIRGGQLSVSLDQARIVREAGRLVRFDFRGVRQ